MCQGVHATTAALLMVISVVHRRRSGVGLLVVSSLEACMASLVPQKPFLRDPFFLSNPPFPLVFLPSFLNFSLPSSPSSLPLPFPHFLIPLPPPFSPPFPVLSFPLPFPISLTPLFLLLSPSPFLSIFLNFFHARLHSFSFMSLPSLLSFPLLSSASFPPCLPPSCTLVFPS